VDVNRASSEGARGRREGGFVVELPEDDVYTARDVLELLEFGEWLDEATRALFIEFTLYLTATNILLAARLVVEVHSTGTVWTDLSLEPINLMTYSVTKSSQTALFAAGVVAAALAILWDVYNAWRMRRHRLSGGGAVGPPLSLPLPRCDPTVPFTCKSWLADRF
jgi:Polycystin cation channel